MPIGVARTEQFLPHCQEPSTQIFKLLAQRAAAVRQVRRGEPVCLAVDPADSVYYVRKGCITLVRYSSDGGEVVIDQYRAGSVFGSLCFCRWSLCGSTIDREAALAVEDTEVVLTTFEEFKRNLICHPEALFGLLEDFCRRLAAARLRIEGLVLHEAEERLARALLIMAAYQRPDTIEAAALNVAITHEEIAKLIGVSRPFVTKIVGQLRDRGFIESIAAGLLLVHRDRIAKAYL